MLVANTPVERGCQADPSRERLERTGYRPDAAAQRIDTLELDHQTNRRRISHAPILTRTASMGIEKPPPDITPTAPQTPAG
jgi:hypothetical protein